MMYGIRAGETVLDLAAPLPVLGLQAVAVHHLRICVLRSVKKGTNGNTVPKNRFSRTSPTISRTARIPNKSNLQGIFNVLVNKTYSGFTEDETSRPQERRRKKVKRLNREANFNLWYFSYCPSGISYTKIREI